MGASLELLVFSCNNPGAVRALLEASQNHVDTTLVVDSSDPPRHRELLGLLKDLPLVRTMRAIPLGLPEPLQSFAHAQLTAEWALRLDTDERLPEGAWTHVRKAMADPRYRAYVLPRRELPSRSFSFHLRLFHWASTRFGREGYGFPEVSGDIGRFPRSLAIEHHPSDPRYPGDPAHVRSNSFLDSYLRPLDSTYLRRALGLAEGTSPGGATTPLNAPAVRVLAWMEWLRHVLTTGSTHWPTWNLRYTMAYLAYVQTLPPGERERRFSIAADIRRAGGIGPYLGLDDPSYVETLTRTFSWDLSGPELLGKLLAFRYQHQRAARSCAEIYDGGAYPRVP